MTLPFSGNITQPGNAPPWLRGGTGERLLYTFGTLADARMCRLIQGIKSALPRSTIANNWQAPDDALAAIGSNRGLARGPTEPSAAYATRLQRAPDEWQIWGSPRACLDQICAYFSPLPMTARIVTDSGQWFTMTSTGTPPNSYTVPTPAQRYPGTSSNWSWDGASKWWRAWLIIHLPVGYSAEVQYNQSGVAYDGGAIYDGVAASTLAALSALATFWFPEHATMSGVIFTTLQPTQTIPGQTVHPFDPLSVASTNSDGSTNLPTGNWGGVLNPGGTTPSRPSWASFYGTNP